MNVPEISEVKDHLDKLVKLDLIKSWELPYENLLTRRSAAIFFFDALNSSLNAIDAELSKYQHYSFRVNKEKTLSQLEYRLTFNEEEYQKNSESSDNKNES